MWKRHHRFSLDGTWDRVLTALLADADADAAGDIDWPVSVDSSSMRHRGPGRPRTTPAALRADKVHSSRAQRPAPPPRYPGRDPRAG